MERILPHQTPPLDGNVMRKRLQVKTITDPIIAYGLFTDGAKRPVYQEPGGKQYVIDDRS
jgi:hypothetical protein